MLGGTSPVDCDMPLIGAVVIPIRPPKLVFEVVW
jgi:hypothetical protein